VKKKKQSNYSKLQFEKTNLEQQLKLIEHTNSELQIQHKQLSEEKEKI